jgi:hypothetical protein
MQRLRHELFDDVRQRSSSLGDDLVWAAMRSDRGGKERAGNWNPTTADNN